VDQQPRPNQHPAGNGKKPQLANQEGKVQQGRDGVLMRGDQKECSAHVQMWQQRL
jgi:hypothetical protein